MNTNAGLAAPSAIRIIECDAHFQLTDDVLRSGQPILLKNLVGHWPIVQAAKVSAQVAAQYLLQFYKGMEVVEVQGDAALQGRIAYTADFARVNCVSARKSLALVLEDIFTAAAQPEPPLFYMGTTHLQSLLPGFSDANLLDLSAQNASAFMWLGNRSCVPAHYDLPDNLACNVVGRRRFTLFPPEQLENLYIGPPE